MKRKSNEASIKEVLKAMVDQYQLRGKLDQTQLRQTWTDLVGEPIARYTRNIRIHRDKLYIDISAPALRQELTYGREKIRSLVNDALGEERIKDVIIR